MNPVTNEVKPSDEALALRLGSSPAFTELFERYQQPIFAFFCRRVGETAQAEELTQETFLALLRGAVRYEPRTLFRTYLYAIAFRILRSHRRKASFRALITGADPTGRDVCVANSTEVNYWVRQALEKLPATDREILMLREFEELSYAEISAVLRIRLNTVRSRLFRARMALKVELAGAPRKEITGLEPSHEPNR